MFIVLLKFSVNKANASEYMAEHNNWIKQGFDEGIFLLVGSIESGKGGSIIAHNISMSELEKKVNEDPFVEKNVVNAEILEISPKKLDERLNFLSS